MCPLFWRLKTIATLVNYTSKIFIKLTPGLTALSLIELLELWDVQEPTMLFENGLDTGLGGQFKGGYQLGRTVSSSVIVSICYGEINKSNRSLLKENNATQRLKVMGRNSTQHHNMDRPLAMRRNKRATQSYNSRAAVGRLTLMFRIFHSYVDVGNQVLVQSGRADIRQANFTTGTSTRH